MRGIRTSLRRTLIVFAATLAAAGCGADERAAETTTPRPTLPRTVADDLAARSDAIADALDAGDVCTAAVRADELQAATIAAINNGQVPEDFQEDLQARANELVNTINCPPPPTTTEEEGDDENRGRGNKKGKNKNEGDGGNDAVITIPPPTEAIP